MQPLGSGDEDPENSGSGGTDPIGAGGQNSGAGGMSSGADDAIPPQRDGFSLLFHDDFDALDTARWGTASHTFAENGAQFTPENVVVEDGLLKLRVTQAAEPSTEDRMYRAGELRTHDFFGHGRFEARVKFAAGSGVVSSLFTYYDHWADPALPENWNEIDIEYLGNSPESVQFNVIHWNALDQRTTHEAHVDVGFLPAEEFHVVAIEWLPTAVKFYIDEQLVHEQTEQIEEFLTLDSRLMMNAWPVSDAPGVQAWAGVPDDAALPTEAQYDWVRAYEYVGP